MQMYFKNILDKIIIDQRDQININNLNMSLKYLCNNTIYCGYFCVFRNTFKYIYNNTYA